MKRAQCGVAAFFLSPALIMWGQARTPAKAPFQTQSPSTLKYGVEDHSDVVEMNNVSFDVVGSGIPGRPRYEHLVLRKTVHLRDVVGDIGVEATTTVEAWPVGVDLKQRPLYSVTASGMDPSTRNAELLLIQRGLEEFEWWSVYKLGTGAHLFDTDVPVLEVSIQERTRYAGLQVPGDDVKDARLKAPNVVAVLTYASGERVLREALITCDDKERAILMRSFADSSRTLTSSAAGIRLAISQNYPVRALGTITVPVVNDNLDLAHAQLPAGVHIAAFTR